MVLVGELTALLFEGPDVLEIESDQLLLFIKLLLQRADLLLLLNDHSHSVIMVFARVPTVAGVPLVRVIVFLMVRVLSTTLSVH